MEQRFERDTWLYVRMDKSLNGADRARHFFNASSNAKVEETAEGYRVEAAKCHPGAGNDA